MQKNELFTIISEAVDNPLSEALLEYKDALDRGNYKANWLDADKNWTDEDELAVIYKALMFALEKLNLQEINQEEELQANLKKHLPISLHEIAHLLASLTILGMQEGVEPDKELEQLKAIGVLAQARASMPVPCIAYLGALRCSSLDKKTKFIEINNIIIDLLDNRNKFGILSNIALRVAIQDWLNVLNELGPDFEAKFSIKIKKYKNELENSPTVSETQEKLTIIEKYILSSCQNLKNGIGQINLAEPYPTISSETDKTLVEGSNQTSSKSGTTFFSPVSTSVLSGELLESSSELILGELEMLVDITDPSNKNLLGSASKELVR